MKIAIALTNDWELYGDGSGDYFEIQHNRLKEFLEYSRNTNVKMTIMAEVLQQLYHIKFQSKVAHFANISQAWESILKEAIEDGHDVQLHLHPQWLNAKYTDSKWVLDMNNTSIGSLNSNIIEMIIKQGKDYLEKLLQFSDPNYTCNCFRAGAYCIEPSKHVIKALISNSFKLDTSVSKGLKNHSFFDFSDAYSNWEWWHCTSESVKYKGNTCLLEFPIFSDTKPDSLALKKLFPKLYHILFHRINIPKDEIKWMVERQSYKEKHYPTSKRYYKTNQKKNIGYFLNAIFSPQTIQLDYDYLPASLFVKKIQLFFDNAKYYNIQKDEVVPIVASGHFKDIHNLNNLKKIVKLLTENFENKIEFVTLSDILRIIDSNKKDLK